MRLSSLLKIFLGTASLAQESQKIDLCHNVTDYKQLDIINNNNTVRLSYGTNFHQGCEFERYAPCVTDDTFRKIVPDITKTSERTDKVACNIAAYFTPKDKSLVVKAQLTSLSAEQCKLFENITWSTIYNCIEQIDSKDEILGNIFLGMGLAFWCIFMMLFPLSKFLDDRQINNARNVEDQRVSSMGMRIV